MQIRFRGLLLVVVRLSVQSHFLQEGQLVAALPSDTLEITPLCEPRWAVGGLALFQRHHEIIALSQVH